MTVFRPRGRFSRLAGGWAVLALVTGGQGTSVSPGRSDPTASPLLVQSGLQVSDARIGMTLFPDPVRAGELLRFVIDGTSRGEPGDASVARTYTRGDTIRAARALQINGVRWVELRNTGYIEAARIDRIPLPIADDLAPGREGLSLGRVLPWEYAPSDLETVSDVFKVADFNDRAILLRRDALRAFERMIQAAGEDGVIIRIFSGWRSAKYQAGLYARNVGRRGPAQRVSAAPGRSEHQLGTATDIATPDVPLMTPTIATAAAGLWIERRAAECGIVVSFSRDRHEGRGVAFEPWHLRWVGSTTIDDREW